MSNTLDEEGQAFDAVVKGRLEVATYLVQGTTQKEAGGERDRVDLSKASKQASSDMIFVVS